MRIKRNDFLNALKLVMPGAGEGVLGGPTVVVFNKGWIRTMNDILSVSYKLETGIEGSVVIRQLYKALKMMKSDDLLISSDKDQAVFRCGFSEIALNLISASRFEERAINLDDMKWQPAPKSLLDGLKLSLLSAEDSEIGRLSGVIITDNLIVSTDNYRISVFDMCERTVEEPVRLRTSTVKVLVKMKESYEHVSASEKWFHLKNNSLIVSLRQSPLIDYPLDKVIDAFNTELHPEVYKLPANLGQYIDRAELLAGSGVGELSFSTQISLKSKDGKLVITGENGVGSLSSKIPWSGIMPKLTIDPRTLRELLKLTHSFKIGTGKKQQQFVEFQVPNFKFIIVGKTEQVQEQVTQKADTKQELATKLQHLRELRERRN